MKNTFFFLAIFLFCNTCFSQELVYFDKLPTPTGVEKSSDSSIPKVGWNRWTTTNFTILSIDLNQGDYLKNNIEQMKKWCMERWGFKNISYKTECRVFCVPNKETMLKLFNIELSRAEIANEINKNTINYLWLVLDGRPAEIIPSALTLVSLREYELTTSTKIGWWAHRGIAGLNLSIIQIKTNIMFSETYIEKDDKIFFSKSLFSITEETWKKMSAEEQRLFDSEAISLCLMIRKEFGQEIFLNMLGSTTEKSLRQILSFSSYSHFDITFKRFIVNIVKDVKDGKTPENYLQILRKD
jgi:hypothetical protein